MLCLKWLGYFKNLVVYLVSKLDFVTQPIAYQEGTDLISYTLNVIIFQIIIHPPMLNRQNNKIRKIIKRPPYFHYHSRNNCFHNPWSKLHILDSWKLWQGYGIVIPTTFPLQTSLSITAVSIHPNHAHNWVPMYHKHNRE